MYRRFEAWCRQHPFLFSWISYFLLEGGKFLLDVLRGVDYSSVLEPLLVLLNVDFSIKVWHIGILFTLSAMVFKIWSRFRHPKSKVLPKKSRFDLDLNGIRMLIPPNASSLTGELLSSPNGMFCIWAHVTDTHNQVRSTVDYKYIVGYSSNNGQEQNNPLLARYPTAWAICRVSPVDSDHLGAWRFWCNSAEKERTEIDDKRIVGGGWHVFTVAWSLKDNYIKFLIDKSLVASARYANWPSDFSGSIRLGSWSRAPEFYFGSQIGRCKFVPQAFDNQVLSQFVEQGPGG
jgi:hypothetical protein